MSTETIRLKVKEIIANVTNLPIDEIADEASYREDLGLDSLTLLEIGVDLDYEFKLGLPEETLQELASVGETVTLVLQHQGAAAVA